MNKQILSALAVVIVLLFGGMFGLHVFDNDTAADVTTNISQNIPNIL